MGVFNRIFGSGKASDHALPAASQILEPTNPDAYHPNNPGDMKPVRSVPVLKEPRPFTSEQLGDLESMVEERREASKNFQEGLALLSEVEGLDASDQGAFRKYQGKVSDAELAKLKANAGYIQHLQGQRTDYAQLADGLTRAQMESDRRVGQMLGRVRGLMGGQRNG
jgi:hypothetical protein